MKTAFSENSWAKMSTILELARSIFIEEVSPEDLGYAEDEMAVRNGLKDFFTQPFAKFDHPFLVAGWTEVAALA